jgi:osmotically-inducible protein OsmY
MMETPAGPGAIRRALASLRISDLRVEVMDGCVHLHGVTPSYEQKRLAGEMATQVAGRPVVNELRIAQRGFEDDERVLQDVARELARLPHDIAGRVVSEAIEGVVRLRGIARDEGERQAIARAAWSARSVTGVENHLVLEGEAVSDADVARALSEYVQRAANLPGGVVTVDFSRGVASLSGSVPSSVQRHAIEDLIRWHDGVEDVENRLHVVPADGRRAGHR